MEAIQELVELSDAIRQASALLADDDVDDDKDSKSSSRRPSTFLNAVVLGNVVSKFLSDLLALPVILYRDDFADFGALRDIRFLRDVDMRFDLPAL